MVPVEAWIILTLEVEGEETYLGIPGGVAFVAVVTSSKVFVFTGVELMLGLTDATRLFLSFSD